MTPECGATEAWCHCLKDEGHDGPHLCECEGSWTFDENGRFVVVALPSKYVGPPTASSELDWVSE